jgi:RHS repeat-associated protein
VRFRVRRNGCSPGLATGRDPCHAVGMDYLPHLALAAAAILAFDAWNRLVSVKNGGPTLSAYSFDALGRRVTENSGTAKALYYSAGWQVIEERDSGLVRVQSVFSPVYIDGLIERDRDPSGGGTLTERLWAQQDANWNVTALTDGTGAVQERYVYDPYGKPTVLTGAWGARASSAYSWVYLHQGGRYDAATGLYLFRNRDYSPTLGRWMQVDPLGFTAGDVNFYRALSNSPESLRDPTGLAALQHLYGKTVEGPKPGWNGSAMGYHVSPERRRIRRRRRDSEDPDPGQGLRLRRETGCEGDEGQRG